MAPEGFWLSSPWLQGGHCGVQRVLCSCPWCKGDARDPDSDSQGAWRSLTGTGAHSPACAARVLLRTAPGGACSPSRAARVLLCTALRFCCGLETPKPVPAPSPLCFVRASVALTSRFLFLRSALPRFHSLPRTHLILFICLFCSFSFHPSDKRVLSPLSAPVSSSHLQ